MDCAVINESAVGAAWLCRWMYDQLRLPLEDLGLAAEACKSNIMCGTDDDGDDADWDACDDADENAHADADDDNGYGDRGERG